MVRQSIYLNGCSHGLPDRATLDRMRHHLAREAEIGPVGALADCEAEIAAIRADAARLLRAAPTQVGFGPGTAMLWTRLLDRTLRLGARVLLSAYEWGDHVRHLRAAAQRIGVVLDVVPAAEGADPAAWAARIDGDVVAICIPQVTSIEGRIFPVSDIAALPRPDDTLVLVDAAQALGRAPVAGPMDGVDIVVATGRKWLRAPRQTAIAALSDRAERVLGLKAASLEGTDVNTALRLGLGTASRLALDTGLKTIRDGIDHLDRSLRDGLAAIRPDLTVLPARTVGTVTILVPTDAQAALAARLAAAGIIAKWCDPSRDEPLAPGLGFGSPLRVSPHLYNGPSDIAAILRGLAPV